MSKLKLEVGKTYLNRRGDRIKILRGDGSKSYPFMGTADGKLGGWFTENGLWREGAIDDERDLIALADDAPVERKDMGESQPQMITDWNALASVPQQEMKVKRLHPDAVIPTYATDGSACLDLYALEGSYVDDIAHVSEIIPTGLAFEIPAGHVMLIFSRSGHAFKNNVRLANCVAVIDQDFRGEVKIKLTADSDGVLGIKPGDRIAQAMLVPIPRVKLVEVDELSETVRGEGGFGSTGV